MILLSADGMSGREIAERVGISTQHVSRIRARFVAGGVEGLVQQPKAGRTDHAVSAEIAQKIVQTALSPRKRPAVAHGRTLTLGHPASPTPPRA